MRHSLLAVALVMLAACNEIKEVALVRVESTQPFDASAASEAFARETARGTEKHRAVLTALMTLAPERTPATTYLEITRTQNGLLATAIFDDIAEDDSISGYRYTLTFSETDKSTLEIKDAQQSHRCWSDRGHRDFSIKPCS